MAAVSANGGDFQVFNTQGVSKLGSINYKVASGTVASIAAGQMVTKSLDSNYVAAPTTSSTTFPSVGSNYIAGISETVSTETASAAGYVQVTPVDPNMIFLVNPNSAAAWDTQAEYDALVGARVKLNVSSAGTQTLLATDNQYNGLVVMPLDISKYPGKVAVSFRAATQYLS